MIQFIYFDFDDTLIDIGKLHDAAFQFAIETTDCKIDFKYSDVAGLDTLSAFKALGFGESESRNLSKTKQEFFEQLTAKGRPSWVEGITDLLDTLDSIGISYGVVSSGTKKRLERTLMDLDSLNRFAFIISKEDVLQTKPHPEPYLLAISKTNVSVSSSLAVEDSINGYTAANSAGLDVWQLTTKDQNQIFAPKNGSAKHLKQWIICEC
jgi:HAD superfamily hydrolase (TIGR01509 family)